MLKRLWVISLLIFTQAVMAETLDRVVAVVNDGVITQSELNAQVALLRKQMQAKNTQMPPDHVLAKQVLQHLIDVNLQLQLAKQNDMTIDSAEIDDAIQKIAKENHLSLEQLKSAVEEQGLSWASYRENIRKEMLMARVQQKAVGKDVLVSEKLVEDYLKQPVQEEEEKSVYHLQNIVIPLPEEPTSEQVVKAKEKAFELIGKLKNGEDFERLAVAESSGEFALEGGDLGERHLAELPEIFAKQVVNMHQGDVSTPIRTGNGFQIIKLKSIKGIQKKHEVTKTHVRHILLKHEASMTDKEAEIQAKNVYQQLISGKDFAQMAKQHSLDSASAIKGGDLGWVGPGELVPQFETVMDGLPINKISHPVKTMFGWHIIQVLGRKKVDDSVSFRKQQIRQFLHQRKFMEAVQNWQQHLRADAYIKVMDKELA